MPEVLVGELSVGEPFAEQRIKLRKVYPAAKGDDLFGLQRAEDFSELAPGASMRL